MKNLASENVLAGIAIIGLVLIGLAAVFHAIPAPSASIVSNIASGLIGALSMRAVTKLPPSPPSPPPGG